MTGPDAALDWLHARVPTSLQPDVSNLPVTALDLVVLGVVFLSALLAAVRGFTREVLAIGWSRSRRRHMLCLHAMVLPYAKDYIPNPQLALAASIAAVFLGTLVIVSLITWFVRLILDSKIRAARPGPCACSSVRRAAC